VTTRLKRTARDGIKFIKMIKAITAFEKRSLLQMFFYKHELHWRDEIERLQ